MFPDVGPIPTVSTLRSVITELRVAGHTSFFVDKFQVSLRSVPRVAKGEVGLYFYCVLLLYFEIEQWQVLHGSFF